MSGKRVCLLSAGQPSTNPRLVKEADALSEVGYDVKVLCGIRAPWALEADRELLRERAWECRYVGGHPRFEPLRYHWTRMRHAAVRRLVRFGWERDCWLSWGLSRLGPELRRTALSQSADLYLAHYPGALVAAAAAARHHHALLGFDLEDLYSAGDPSDSPQLTWVKRCERRYLHRCHFLTAASPGIAQAYRERYEVPEPVCILNVFPLRMRPQRFPERRGSGPLGLYWFSQTIGAGRGLESVIEAMALADAPTQLHLRGEWQDGYRRRLHGWAAQQGIDPSRVIWHPPAPPDEMARLASQFDIGLAVEPGRDENNRLAVSNKIFTYLLAGIAVAATATPGQAAICRQLGEAAFVYGVDEPHELAGRFDAWYRDRESLERARLQSWRLGEERFNWEREKLCFLEVVRGRLGEP